MRRRGVAVAHKRYSPRAPRVSVVGPYRWPCCYIVQDSRRDHIFLGRRHVGHFALRFGSIGAGSKIATGIAHIFHGRYRCPDVVKISGHRIDVECHPGSIGVDSKDAGQEARCDTRVCRCRVKARGRYLWSASTSTVSRGARKVRARGGGNSGSGAVMNVVWSACGTLLF